MVASLKWLRGVIVMTSLGLGGVVAAEGMGSLGLADLRWQIVNDTVMGGRSSSQIEEHAGAVRFSGYLNTNGGGFASIRSQRLNADLSDASSIRIRVRGDGRRYSVRLYADGQRVSYQHSFVTSEEWQLVEMPIKNFNAVWRGQRYNRPPLPAGDIVGLGLILADGVDGAFAIEVDRLEFFGKAESDTGRWL